MGQPYIGEIRMLGFGFNPSNWALCNGQLLSVNEHPTLFTLIGDTYGGDGRTNFGLPNLQGRAPVQEGNGVVRGLMHGVETVTLTESQLGGHSHKAMGTTKNGGKYPPSSTRCLASSPDADDPVYGLESNLAEMNAVITHKGNGGSHNNMQPSLVINFCIALEGIFPPRI